MDDKLIIVDTDPGIDDAIAIAVLLEACKGRDILVFTTYGNTSLDNTTRNALSLMSLFDVDVPVVRGSQKPAPGNGAYEDASYVHGADGLGGLQGGMLKGLPRRSAVGETENFDYLRHVYDTIRRSGGADYITLGPLTNLASLIERFPDVVGLIGRVVTMGGGIGLGNVTQHAEFNIYCDAESADYVFSKMPDLTLVPLNITKLVSFDLAGIERIGAAGSRVAEAMAAALRANYELCLAYGDPGSTMHDATAVLAYLYPGMFEYRATTMRVACDLERYGMCLPEDNPCGNIRLTTGFNPSEASPSLALEMIARSIISM